MAAESHPDLVQRLSAVPLFSTLDAAELQSVSALVIPFDALAGHVLVQPETIGSGLFLIEEGTVTVSLHDKDIELGPGEFFGELALLDERSMRSARVRAKTPVRGICITRDHFTQMLETEPKVALVMLRVLAHRLADLIDPH